MIKRFGSLYAGHADMSEFGFDTTPVNDRSMTDEELAAPLHTATELAELLERLGFDTLWLAEHHFQPEGYECLPNLPMMAVHIAGRTERIKIGCAFSIAPMWHPLRLAEDYAMADHLTDGRLIFGVGVAIIPGRWRPSADPCSMRTPIETTSKSRWRSSSRRSTHALSRITASISISLRKFPTGATSSRRSPWCRDRSTYRSRSTSRL